MDLKTLIRCLADYFAWNEKAVDLRKLEADLRELADEVRELAIEIERKFGDYKGS